MTQENPVEILLVEDDPAHAEIVRRNLESFQVGKRLHHVADGQAALDFLLRQGAYRDPESSPRPALILLDLRLPKVDGLEVLRRIKADDGLKTIPTIILTTSAAESDMASAYTQGAGSYLVKPLEFHRFQSLLQTFGFYWLSWNRFPPSRPGGTP
jgi:two-component system, response regulator